MDWRILTGDCREVLRTLEAGSVDVVIADPPYGVTSLRWDREVRGWTAELRRVLRPAGSLWVFGCMASLLSPGFAREFDGWRFVQDLVWEKHNGSNSAADRFRRVHEHVLQFIPEGRRWSSVYKVPQVTMDATKRTVPRKGRPPHWGEIGERLYVYVSEDGGPRLMRSVLRRPSCHGEAVHPTQKLESVLEPLIAYSCPPGGIVLDPFAGSGSTGVAAVRLGRRFVGIELNPEYAALARRRIEGDAPLLAASKGTV